MLLSALVVAIAGGSGAAEVSLGVQFAGAAAISQPQRTQVGIGGAARFGLQLELLPMLDVEFAGAYLLLPNRSSGTLTRPASMTGAELAVRLHLPFTASRRLTPFLSLEGGIEMSGIEVLTAGASAGVLCKVTPAWTVGLAARFTQGFPFGTLAERDTSRLSLVSAGVIVEYSISSYFRRKPAAAPLPPPEPVAEPVVLPPPVTPLAAVPPVPPRALETQPATVKSAGPKNAVLTATRVELRQQLLFEPHTTRLMPGSDPPLTELEHVLREHSELCVRIEGHTDLQGDAFANLELSAGRAETVRDALVARKIDTRRLIPRGFGATAPIASNSTVAGRERNRRVEFVIVPCPGKKVSR